MPGEIFSFSVPRGATRWIYCEPLTVATFFSPLLAASATPVARHRPPRIHTVLPDTFSDITVMQSLKVKHGAIIRRDILRNSLASFLRAARKTGTTKNEGTALRSVSIRKLRCRDIRFTRRILSTFIATASPSLSATLINRDETEQDELTDRSVDTFALNSIYTKLKSRERKNTVYIVMEDV